MRCSDWRNGVGRPDRRDALAVPACVFRRGTGLVIGRRGICLVIDRPAGRNNRVIRFPVDRGFCPQADRAGALDRCYTHTAALDGEAAAVALIPCNSCSGCIICSGCSGIIVSRGCPGFVINRPAARHHRVCRQAGAPVVFRAAPGVVIGRRGVCLIVDRPAAGNHRVCRQAGASVVLRDCSGVVQRHRRVVDPDRARRLDRCHAHRRELALAGSHAGGVCVRAGNVEGLPAVFSVRGCRLDIHRRVVRRGVVHRVLVFDNIRRVNHDRVDGGRYSVLIKRRIGHIKRIRTRRACRRSDLDGDHPVAFADTDAVIMVEVLVLDAVAHYRHAREVSQGKSAPPCRVTVKAEAAGLQARRLQQAGRRHAAGQVADLRVHRVQHRCRHIAFQVDLARLDQHALRRLVDRAGDVAFPDLCCDGFRVLRNLRVQRLVHAQAVDAGLGVNRVQAFRCRLDLAPQAAGLVVELDPQAFRRQLELRPQAAVRVLELDPQARRAHLHFRSQRTGLIRETHPQAFGCHFHFRAHAGDLVLELDPHRFAGHFKFRPGTADLVLELDPQAFARHLELRTRAADLVFKLDPQAFRRQQELAPGAVVQILKRDPQAFAGHPQQAVNVPALVEYLIQQMLPVGLEQVVLLRLPGAGLSAAASPRLLLDNRGHVLAVVRQGDRYALRFLSPVAPLLLHDPLGDSCPVFRQRALAHLVQLQVVQRFAGFLAQFQPADLDAHARLAVFVQPPLCPALQARLGAFALIRLPVIHPSVCALILAQVPAVHLQVVLPRRVDPGVHPAPGDAFLQRQQVPFSPHLAPHRVVPLPHVQYEREHAQVVFPHRAVQRIRHAVQGVQQRVPVELIRQRLAVLKIAQRPRAVLAQDILHRLLRRAGRRPAPGDRRRRHLAQADVVQGFDHVFQFHRPGIRQRVLVNPAHSPYIRPLRPVVVQQPVVERDRRRVRPQRDRCGAVPFRQCHRLAFRLEPFAPRQAVPAQFVHIMQTSRCS